MNEKLYEKLRSCDVGYDSGIRLLLNGSFTFLNVMNHKDIYFSHSVLNRILKDINKVRRFV